jgi:hypothetical protein
MSSLKDPASFAPPPRRVDSGGVTAEAPSQEETRKGPLSPAEYRAREDAKLKLEKEQQRLEREEKARLRAEQRGEQLASGPALPFRNDTTGLSTNNFAPPVARRVAEDGTIVTRPTGSPTSRPKPSLPPRLPDRQNSNQTGAPPPPPRLPARSSTGSSSAGASPVSDNKTQLNELQSVFAARSRATFPTSAAAPTQDVAWKRQRNDAASYSPSPTTDDADFGGPITMSDNTAPPKKKAPPPVPRKRAENFGAGAIANNGPPPLPLSTKPKPK